MDEHQSIVIAGHGYADCLMAAALVALKEMREGREPRLLMAARARLATVLRELVAEGRRPARVHLVGIGLRAGREELAEVLRLLQKDGVRVFWYSNLEMEAETQALLGGLLEPIVELCDSVTAVAFNHASPWGEWAAEARKLLRYEQYAALRSFCEVAGFVNRVMVQEHRERVLSLFLKELWERRLGSFSAELSEYIRVYERMGRRELKGHSPAMQELRALIRRAAAVDSMRIMVFGETGTGKESVANFIHLNSPRWNKPFLAFNCASTNPDLQEAAFRGYCKGAFTGAVQKRKSIFEQVDGGTLFLDEVGDLSLEAQGLLLRILEEKRVLPIGGHEEAEVNVRLIAATNKNLWDMVDEGRFREDLLYRLQEFTIRTSALRDIPTDIPAIADAMWRQLAGQPLPEAAASPLMAYEWPGNSRELMNVLKFAYAMGDEDWGGLLGRYLAQSGCRPRRNKAPLPDRLDEMCALHCKRLYEECGGNVTRAAERLGIERATLRRHLRRAEAL